MNGFISIFPGQGSQKVGMGKDFFDNSKTARQMFDMASERLDIDFEKLLFTQNSDLEKTEFTQPAILLVSVIAHRLFSDELKKTGIFYLGHSLGEFSALVATEALDFLDAMELVYNRGLFMTEACEGKDAGMMALLGIKDNVVEEITQKAREEGKSVWAANYNNDGQLVIAGKREDLAQLESVFKENGAKRAILLNMSVASHCPLLSEASERLTPYLEKFLKESFKASVISNVSAKPYNSKDDAVRLLKEQLVRPVLYKQSIKAVENDTDRFIEFGGAVLKGINKKITKKETLSITDMSSLEKVLSEVS